MINKFAKNASNLYNATIRRRFNKYYETEPVSYSRIGAMIGITEKTLKEFAEGADLLMDFAGKLSRFLNGRGY